MRADARCRRSCPGPSFAVDVARGLPTAVTLAAHDEALAARLARALGSGTFRPYHSTDVRGVEIGGAAKNVLAIAAGIVTGRELGASAAAALTTRGFRRAGALRPRLRRAARDADRPVRPRRPDPDLLEPAVAQFLARHRTRQEARHREGATHGKLAEGVFTAPVLVEMAQAEERRHADRRRGRRGARRQAERRRRRSKSLLTRPFRPNAEA